MKNITILLAVAAGMLLLSCNNKMYSSNGERIYRTGSNLLGEKLLDRSASRIRIIHSCSGCHGKTGTRMNNVSIRFSDLSRSVQNGVPYNDSLFFRFLDQDLKSDGSKANIGVLWKMNDKDKQDLLSYLKTL